MGFTLTNNLPSAHSKRAASSFNTALHYFLFTQSLFSVVSTDTKYFTKNFYVNPAFWAKFFLLNKLVIPNTLPIVVDGAQYRLNSLS